MDRTIPTIARTLGTTSPRVARAINRLGIRLSEPKSRGRGRPVRIINESDFERLRDDLGVSPPADSYSREELFVLAALGSETRGFESTRALARASGISPTTAAKLVARLEGQGLIARRRGLTRMSGRVVETDLLEVNRANPDWSRIAPLVCATRPPIATDHTEPTIVPRRFWHLFWNVSPSKLRLDANSDFIAARLLLSNDERAVTWAATHLPASSIERTSMTRGLSEPDRERLRSLAGSRQSA